MSEFRHIPSPDQDSLCLADTSSMINNMPPGKWTIPEPYIPGQSKESMRRTADALVVPLVRFLQRAERTRQDKEKFREDGVITIRENAFSAFDVFNHATGIEGESPQEKIKSTIRGFSVLLSPEGREEVNLPEGMLEVSETDITNSKRLVHSLDIISGGSGIREFKD